MEIQTTTSPLHRKDLLVRLTDDNDPFFLFNLCLGEEDFQRFGQFLLDIINQTIIFMWLYFISLKSQQGLLVDFTAFPQKFTGLLQQCRTEESRDVPKFLLQVSHFIIIIIIITLRRLFCFKIRMSVDRNNFYFGVMRCDYILCNSFVRLKLSFGYFVYY